jgi:23S rRNA pseudouridine2605 synthase
MRSNRTGKIQSGKTSKRPDSQSMTKKVDKFKAKGPKKENRFKSKDQKEDAKFKKKDSRIEVRFSGNDSGGDLKQAHNSRTGAGRISPSDKPVIKRGFKPDEKIRLNRFLSNSGVCSRREADVFISTGCVTVNGKIVSELGTKVSLTDDVRFNGEPLTPERKVYLLLNKPKGYVTTTDDPLERKTVMELINSACPERIYPVGRLDRETTGLLLFTNDGELAKKLTHPSYSRKKIYQVNLNKALTKNDLLQIAKGVELDDGFIAADSINYVDEEDKTEIGIEIHSGRNRIVRRIFEHLGYEVVKLDRVFFAGLTKKNLPRGKWRFLTQAEINQLKML